MKPYTYGTCLLIFLISILPVRAQQITFQLECYTSTGDDATAAIENTKGNFVVAGYSYSTSNGFDAVISEVSPLGNIIQSKTFTTTANELLRSIVQTTDGGYFITGSVYTNPSDYDWLLIKLDSAFNTVFYKRYGVVGANDNANSGFEISPGHYAVTGPVGLGGSTKPAVVTVNDSGIVIQQGYLSTNQFASPDYKGYYLGNGEVGITHLSNALTIVDTNGIVLKNYSFSVGIYSTVVIKSNSNEYVIASVDNYGAPTGSSLSLSFIDSSLTTFVSGNKFKVTGKDLLPVNIVKESNGDFIIAANAYDFNSGNYIPVVIKTSATGTLLWSKSYKPGSAVSSKFNSITAVADGGYLLAGNIGPWNNQHMFLVKLDSAGNSNCNTTSYPLTTQTPAPVANSIHAPYTGTINTLTPTTFTWGSLNMTENLICLSTEIVENHNGVDYIIYPSIVDEGFYINAGIEENIFIRIFDMTGKLIKTCNTFSNQWISMDTFKSGIYLVEATGMQTKNHSISKVVKQ